MNKIIGLIAIVLLLTGCDDGEMTLKSFNFSSGNAQTCTNNGLIFKVQGNEALLLQIDRSNFLNISTKDPNTGQHVPREITIGSASNRMIYRTYSGTVSSASICTELPPASPSVIDEYMAQPGSRLSIITEEVKNTDQVITGYNHIITIVNATFTKDGETIIISDNLFGSYQTPLTYRFDFEDEDDDISIQRCEGSFDGDVFLINGDEALRFDLTPETFPVTAGTTTINFADPAETRELIFNEYSASALASLFCNTVPPINPVVTQQWEAVTGNLRIETTIVGAAYEHIFYLDNVIFINRANGIEQFFINSGYRIGKLTITN